MNDTPDTPEPKPPEDPKPTPSTDEYFRRLQQMGATVGRRTGGVEFTGDWVLGITQDKDDPPRQP
jgi:hypothetical protein